jgi:hypothetical protein
MDEQVVVNFKRLCAKKVFHRCYEATSGDDGITLNEFWKTKFNILEAVRSVWQHDKFVCCLNAAWKHLWPDIQDFEWFEYVSAIVKENVLLGESMGLGVDQDDVEDLIQSHSREIAAADLQELDSVIEHESGEEEQDQDNTIPTSEMKELSTA